MARKIEEPEYVAKLKALPFDFIRWDGDFKRGTSKAIMMCSCGKEWSSRAVDLIKGHGCPACAKAKRAASLKKTEEDYLKRTELSGFTFVSWVGGFLGWRSRMKVSCSYGHEWECAIGNLLNGHGCPQCARTSKMDTEEDCIRKIESAGAEFVRWANGYDGCKSKAVVRCEKGHEWTAVAINLSRGYGCHRCAPRGFDTTKRGTLYLLRSEEGDVCKVGISNDYVSRLSVLKRRTPFQWNCIALLHSDDGVRILELEQRIHSSTKQASFNDKFDGYTEWREWDPKILDWYR